MLIAVYIKLNLMMVEETGRTYGALIPVSGSFVLQQVAPLELVQSTYYSLGIVAEFEAHLMIIAVYIYH